MSKPEAEIFSRIQFCLENLSVKYNLYVFNLNEIIIPFRQTGNLKSINLKKTALTKAKYSRLIKVQ